MKILIVSATSFEVKHLLNQMGYSGSMNERFISVSYKNVQIDFLITGIGMVATTYYTTKTVNNSYNFALNVGVCGSFNKNLDLGSVVNIYHDCFSELGAEDNEIFLPLQEMDLEGVVEVINDSQILNSVLSEIPKVSGITVNTVHGNEKSIEKVFNKFHPIVESMEGAAFMLTCKNESIPYAQLRGVSNYVELRNKNNWNLPMAIENVNKKVLNILHIL